MKKIILLSSLLCFSVSLFAQDIIVTRNNERIEAKVLKTYDAVIKYVLFSDPDGETFLMAKSKIVTILYEDGVVETFENASTNIAQQNAIANNKTVAADNEKNFKNVIKLKPFSTILGLINGMADFNFQYSIYFARKVGIPIEVEFFGVPNSGLGLGLTLMTGIEVVPLTHRQKSGLLCNALAGVVVFNGAGVALNANLGYQLVTKQGFVFAAALGPMYEGINHTVALRISVDFGFAF